MNERILELIKQSTVPADQVENYAKSEGLIVPDEKLDVAKFAELIVRECADVAKQFYKNNKEYDASLAIEQHFGVEE